MKKRNIILIGVIALLVIGGGAWALVSRDTRAPSASELIENGASSPPATEDPDELQMYDSDTEVVDGVVVPASVLRYIEAEYPEYSIDSADTTQSASGEAQYELELESRTHDVGDIILIYNEDWHLVSAERE